MKKFIALLGIGLVFCSGCFSTKPGISVSAAYPFEGRYSSSDKIAINGNEAKVKEDESIWILSNNTLYNLLVSVSDSKDKVVFGNRTYTLKKTMDSTEIEKPSQNTNSFDNEEYVWENFEVN